MTGTGRERASTRRGKWPGLAALCALLAIAPAARAEQMPVPTDLQISLILKILTYDRQFEARVGSELTLAVLFSASDPVSLQAKQETMAVLQQVSGKTVKKVPIRFVEIAYTSDEALRAALKAERVNVLYVSPGLGEHVGQVSKLCAEDRITSATGMPDYVAKGVGVGIGLRQNKPQILINLEESKRQGSQFDASLLRIAQIVS